MPRTDVDKYRNALFESQPKAAQNCAVINPYVLAEVIVGWPIPWKKIPDKRSLLEELLGTPCEELFDPEYGGPLCTGLALDPRLRIALLDHLEGGSAIWLGVGTIPL